MMTADPRSLGAARPAQDDWVAAFHAGDRRVIEQCYREYFTLVDARVGRVLQGADRETVVHEIFYQLLTSAPMRQSFRGGSFAAWLGTVAGNAGIDHARRKGREQPIEDHHVDAGALAQDPESDALARVMMERFRQAVPVEWLPVFECRFVHQLTQQEAAASLGIGRTTLAYRELRIRHLLRRLCRLTSEELP
jgi:RNA polymerase sigma-70 factor, ECF subfamily